MTIDRPSRAALAAEIRRYLHERASMSCDLLAQSRAIAERTRDTTVTKIVKLIWDRFDDGEDFCFAETKSDWDYFQRLLLILESDAHLRWEPREIWSFTQLAAALTLIAYVDALFTWGIGWVFVGPSTIFGLLAAGIMAWRVSATIGDHEAIEPFASIGEIIEVRRKTKEFAKERSPAAASETNGPSFFAWCLIAAAFAALGPLVPFVLVAELFPATEIRTSVKMTPGW